MTKKKKRRPRSTTAPPRGGANVERRDRKEEARRNREAEYRRAPRVGAPSHVHLDGYRGGGGGRDRRVPQLLRPERDPSSRGPRRAAVGCTDVEQPAASAPSGQHLQPGQQYTYTDTPATSGLHDPSPLPDDPKVYEEQPPETRRALPGARGGLRVLPPRGGRGVPQDVVDRLTQIAEESDATFLAPYPSLTADRALTLTAWNRRQSCPAGAELTPDAAATIVNGFATAFECRGDGIEVGASPC